MSQRASDLWSRVWRTFAQGAAGVFVATYFGPLMDLMRAFTSLGPGDNLPEIELTLWRNALLAVIAGGFVAVAALLHNWVNDYLGRGNDLPLIGKPIDRAVGDARLGERGR